MNIRNNSFSGKVPNYSELPRQMARKLGSMVRSGRTTAELATEAAAELTPFAGLAADLRRTGATKDHLQELGGEVADIFRGIETETAPTDPQDFNESEVTQTLMASYGESVVKDPQERLFADEHAAVRTFYGKKNGLKRASGSEARPTAKSESKTLSSGQQRALNDFKTFVEERWSRIDKNGDGDLQFDEIHQLAKDDRYSGERLDYIALLLRNFGQFAADSHKVGKERVSVEKRTFEALSDPEASLSQKVGRSALLARKRRWRSTEPPAQIWTTCSARVSTPSI